LFRMSESKSLILMCQAFFTDEVSINIHHY
jgi:hypothetical protein